MAGEFQIQSKLTRQLVISQYRQTAWGTALPDTLLTRVQRFDGSAVPDFGSERRSDRGMSGKGFSFATNSQLIMEALSFTGVKMEATDWNVAWALSSLMGKIVSTGNAAPYTHVITFDETTRTAIPTTLYLRDTADLAYRFLDAFVTKATLTIPAKGSISLDVDIMGTGRKTKGVLAAAPTIPNETYLMGNDAHASFGPVGAQADFLGRFMSATVTIDSQGSVHEAPGGGLFGLFGRRQDPKFSISAVIAAKELDDIFTNFDNNTLVAFSLPIVSGAIGLNISVPSGNLKTTKLGFDNDMPVWNIEMDETTVYQNGNVPPITCTVTSAQPTFMTTAPTGP